MHEVEKRIIFWPDLTRTLSNFMKGSGLMKKKIIITTLVILFVVIFCVAVALWFNPNLNKFKLKSVEKMPWNIYIKHILNSKLMIF